MKMTKMLIAGVLALVATTASASTVFTSTDGDVNFLFRPVAGYEMYLFDDADIGDLDGATNKLFIDVPEVVGITGPLSGGNYVAASSSGSIILTDSANFFIGLLHVASGDWIRDTAVDLFGANSYYVDFGEAIGGIVVDVEEVSQVPVPAAAWLFGSGLIGLVGIARRRV